MITQPSILEIFKRRQEEIGSIIALPDSKSRIAFVFLSKDRTKATVQTLTTLDAEKGFDLIWVDGSDTPEGKALVDQFKPHNFRLIEVHKAIKGKEYAAYLGLDRLFDLGYDYIGLIENELVFEPGWFRRMLQLFELAAEEGLAVGAASVRNYNSRVIEYRDHYTINWCIGAGMALWSRTAFQLIRKMCEPMTARRISRFYAETFGIDLGEAIFRGRPDRMISCDWTYEVSLYQHGLTTVSSIPSLARDLILDIHQDLMDSYVEESSAGRGLARPKISRQKLFWLRLTNPFYPLAWGILKKFPLLYRFIQRKLARRYQRRYQRKKVKTNI